MMKNGSQLKIESFIFKNNIFAIGKTIFLNFILFSLNCLIGFCDDEENVREKQCFPLFQVHSWVTSSESSLRNKLPGAIEVVTIPVQLQCDDCGANSSKRFVKFSNFM